MSWKVLTDETAKSKREKKRRRKIKRGSKQGRYVVLGSRGRKGRKSALHCTICSRTLRPDSNGLVCTLCEKETTGKIQKLMKQMAPKPFKHHVSQMEIPEMSKE